MTLLFNYICQPESPQPVTALSDSTFKKDTQGLRLNQIVLWGMFTGMRQATHITIQRAFSGMNRKNRPSVTRIWLLHLTQYPLEEQVTLWTEKAVLYLQWLLQGGASFRAPVPFFEQHNHLVHPLKLPHSALVGASSCCSTASCKAPSHWPFRSDTFIWCFLSGTINRYLKCFSTTTRTSNGVRYFKNK